MALKLTNLGLSLLGTGSRVLGTGGPGLQDITLSIVLCRRGVSIVERGSGSGLVGVLHGGGGRLVLHGGDGGLVLHEGGGGLALHGRSGGLALHGGGDGLAIHEGGGRDTVIVGRPDRRLGWLLSSWDEEGARCQAFLEETNLLDRFGF